MVSLVRCSWLSVVSLIFVVSFVGCYSFTGASVPPHLKTIAIPLFDDQSGSGEPNLREQLTNKLQESFIRDNNFKLADKRTADALLEGTITSMPNEPAVLTKGEQVTKNRLTVNVRVAYRDQKMKKQMWEKQFSRYADYDISGGPSAKQAAITTAIEQLTEDILLDTVSGW
ncbi:MAG: LptE family protein [Ignavibacteriae bacterium]|nr:LptE family protein [Ignavibacteriota bacterium]